MDETNKFLLKVFLIGIVFIIVACVFKYFEFNKFLVTIFNTMGGSAIGSCIGLKLAEIF